MAHFEVTLQQKIKLIISADSASEGLSRAMAKVTEEKNPFTPSTWTVKEKDEEENE
jgi:hypothetical protein